MTQPEKPHPPEFYAGLELFNRGFYFECHDVWEEIWGDAKGKNKIFYQALIMSAVSLYHFGNENLEGALSCLQKAEKQFSQLPEVFLGLHVARFVQQMKQFFEGMTLGQTELTEDLLAKARPKIAMEELGGVARSDRSRMTDTENNCKSHRRDAERNRDKA